MSIHGVVDLCGDSFLFQRKIGYHTMNRLLSTLLLLLAVSFAFAQNSAQKKRIQAIREQMQSTMQLIEDNAQEPEYTDNSIHLQINRMLPGAGMQHYTIDMYITDCGNEEEMEQDWRPYFFRIKYNFAARQIIQEHLIDAESGKPIFIFVKMPDEDGLYEDRIYYNADGSFCYATQTKFEAPDGKKSVKVLKENDDNVQSAINFSYDVMKWAHDTQNM